MNKDLVKNIIIVILATIFVIGIPFLALSEKEPETTERLTLVNMDGYYATVKEVSAELPIDNYTAVTLLTEEYGIITIEGTLNILYQKDEPAYAIWKKSELAANDIVELHVPIGATKYLRTEYDL